MPAFAADKPAGIDLYLAAFHGETLGIDEKVGDFFMRGGDDVPKGLPGYFHSLRSMLLI